MFDYVPLIFIYVYVCGYTTLAQVQKYGTSGLNQTA